MGKIIQGTVRLIQAVQRIRAKKWSFFGFFVIVFFGSVFILGQLGLLPETISATAVEAVTPTDSPAPTVVELPTKIEISKISLSANVVNPTATDIASLDKELLKGAVRYPTSAKLGETGNVVLFGHSSYLPVVGNQAYKAFNDIQKLAVGDVVTVYSAGTAYTYRVRVVEKKTVTNDGIELSITGRVLTLVTCNSFGAKEDRFMVTADFVESHLISK